MGKDSLLIVACKDHLIYLGQCVCGAEQGLIVVAQQRTGLGHHLGGCDGLVEEVVHLGLGTARLEREAGPYGGSRPLAVARHKAGAGMVAFPSGFVECHARLEGIGRIAANAPRLRLLGEEERCRAVEIGKDEACHLVAWGATALLREHSLVIGQHLGQHRHITIGTEQTVIVVGTEEIGFAQVMVDVGISLTESTLLDLPLHLVDEEVERADVGKVPPRLCHLHGLLVAFVEKVLGIACTLVVTDNVLGIESTPKGIVRRQYVVKVVHKILQFLCILEEAVLVAEIDGLSLEEVAARMHGKCECGQYDILVFHAFICFRRLHQVRWSRCGIADRSFPVPNSRSCPPPRDRKCADGSM